MYGFEIGDKVIADKAIYEFLNEKFTVTGFEVNAIGRPLIVVVHTYENIGETVFYPEELSHVSE